MRRHRRKPYAMGVCPWLSAVGAADVAHDGDGIEPSASPQFDGKVVVARRATRSLGRAEARMLGAAALVELPQKCGDAGDGTDVLGFLGLHRSIVSIDRCTGRVRLAAAGACPPIIGD